MLIKLLLYNFGDKKTDQKAQILIPEYGKSLLQNFIPWKKFLFCYFHTLTFAL